MGFNSGFKGLSWPYADLTPRLDDAHWREVTAPQIDTT